MAEAIAFGVGVAVEVANIIIKKFGSAAYKKILFVKDQDSHIERLREIKSNIAAALRRVDPFETSRDDIVRLRRIHDDLVYFFDERATRTKQKEVMGNINITAKVRSSLKQLVSPLTVAEKVSVITNDLINYASDYALTSNIVTNSSGNQNRCTLFLETGPFPDTDVLIGRDRDKENIINMLCNSSNNQMSPSVVAIVGVGGQGKTTLAQYVCNDERVKGSFDKLLWVSSAPDSGVRDLVEKIITSATGMKPCNYGKEELQRSLLHVIVGKKCLIVLDNVWYQDSLSADWLDWKTLLGKGGFEASGSKFLITTRNKRAAKIMGVPAPYMLRDLATENDSWTLLRHFALVQEKESGVVEIGKEIAKMCPKLPLVIKVVGLQLAEKDTTKQWKNFMKKLASTPSLYMQDNKIMQTLKLCYDQLHDENLKRCVVFCSLFPKGHEYSTNYMIHLWMALGFLEPEDGISLEDVGEQCVLTLANLGFFEQVYSSKRFKMHDVMHDLILLIGKSTHQVINSETKEIADGVCHVSLNKDSDWRVLLEFKDKRNLQSIISVSDYGNYCSIQVPLSSGFDKLISSCPKLKILEAYSQGIDKVPNSISQMVHLRHLNLSKNPLQKLPNSITQLVNLLSLDVSFCPNLQELPRDINKLDKLKQLMIRGPILWRHDREIRTVSHMPKGIGKLCNLEELDCFVVVGEDKSISGNSKASGAANLEELGCLNNLQRDLWIIVDGESKHLVSEAKTAKLERKTELTALIVEFKNSTEEDEMFLEGLKPHGKNLIYINIINYGGKKLPSWMRDDQFNAHFPILHQINFFYDGEFRFWYYSTSYTEENVVTIRIMRNVDGHYGMLEWVPGYSRLKEQSRFGPIEIELTSIKGNGLKDFTLKSLRITKHIAQTLLCLNLEMSFLNIHKLHLNEIRELEVIPDQFRDLPSLKRLLISRWGKLKAIPDWIGSLTSLVELYLNECPKLESLPHQIGNLPESCKLIIRYCSQVLDDKCWKPTGEYWPLIQHLRSIHISSCRGVEFWHRNGECSNVTTTPLVSPPSNVAPTPLTSDASPSRSNTTFLKPYLFFILVFIMLILLCVVGLRLV